MWICRPGWRQGLWWANYCCDCHCTGSNSGSPGIVTGLLSLESVVTLKNKDVLLLLGEMVTLLPRCKSIWKQDFKDESTIPSIPASTHLKKKKIYVGLFGFMTQIPPLPHCVTESKLALLAHDRPINREMVIGTRNSDFFLESQQTNKVEDLWPEELLCLS